MANELPDNVVIIFFQNPDGSVWGEQLINMPETGSEQEFAFLNEVRRQVQAMPRWEPATCHGEPVITPDGEINATFYTISIKELRP